MTSSGMKRGLATIAVSALAVTGLPALAGTANALPINTQIGGTDTIQIYTMGSDDYAVVSSTKFDGTNETISLVAGASADITSIQFQYRISDAAAWQNIGAVLTRNADGAFQYDWAAPANLDGVSIDVRAVGNDNTIEQIDNKLIDHDEETVELGTEGSLGIYTNPHTSEQHVAVRGTTSSAQNVSVWDETKRNNDADGQVTSPVMASEEGDDGIFRFEGVLTYPTTNKYDFSLGSESNQVVLAAANDWSDDAEASTYYVQTVDKVTVAPETTKVATGGKTSATVTVLDAQGKPVAGAQVGYFMPDDADADTDVEDTTVAGTTDANGQITIADLGKGTYTVYADSSLPAGYNAADVEAQPFTVTEYSPVLTSVEIDSEKDRTAFDIDEIDGETFLVTLTDNEGNPYNGTAQYRWLFDGSDAGSTPEYTGEWSTPTSTGADGELPVTFDNKGVGTYTLEARHPNEGGSGLMNATPMTFEVGESEITFDEGTSAEATSYGTVTYSGNLALVGSGTDLAGRTVSITYSATGDSVVATTQPAGTTKGAGNTATAVTDANGNFSVTLTDPAGPPNVTPYSETGTLVADATELSGLGDVPTADAMDTLTVNWAPAPTPTDIVIDVQTLIDGMYTPGRPAEIDVTVDGDSAAGMQAIKDYPVTVSVDHGFLSPNANEEADLEPAAGSDDDGDLYGVWKNSGTSKDISTGDASRAGIVAAIERDGGFDDDGVVTMTVTVKAGSLTETKTIQFNSDNPLNAGGLELKRMAGEPVGNAVVGDVVDYNVFAKDQFGNLAGNEFVRILDNTTVADFTTDATEDQANSDFSNDGESVSASTTGSGRSDPRGSLDHRRQRVGQRHSRRGAER